MHLIEMPAACARPHHYLCIADRAMLKDEFGPDSVRSVLKKKDLMANLAPIVDSVYATGGCHGGLNDLISST